ncbi:hypothetical protein [Chryseolinea soli]|uniref:hypothetical protein n=1 Tax=Chryseolinea soli TaxID=2321403 RepID=UPI0013573716
MKSKDGSINARFRIDDGSLMPGSSDIRNTVLKRINLWYSRHQGKAYDKSDLGQAKSNASDQ